MEEQISYAKDNIAIYIKMHIFHKEVPFKGPENKILHFDPIFPPNKEILGQFFDWTKFQVRGLNIKNFTG